MGNLYAFLLTNLIPKLSLTPGNSSLGPSHWERLPVNLTQAQLTE